MRGLVLVDLDNVAASGLKSLVSQVQALQSRAKVGEWRVVFALNTTTAERHGLTMKELRDAGSALGTGPAIALALTMPQTADVLIARLAREAPSVEAAGAYQAAILVSRDGDLTEALGSELYQTSSRGWGSIAQGIVSLWRMPEGGKPVVRKPPLKLKPKPARTPEVDQAYTLCVDDASLATWAGGQALGVEPGMELEPLSVLLDEEPWLLSQVGATSSSLRGIDRLARMDVERVLGDIHPKDGVEIRGGGPRPRFGTVPTRASVGIGAVRFSDCAATVATRIPASVLEAASSCSIGRFDVNTRAAIRQLGFDEGLGKVAKVRLEVRGPSKRRVLVAKVQHSSTTQPQVWWMKGERIATSEVRLDGIDLLSAPVLATARSFRPSESIQLDGRDCFLCLRSVVEDGGLVVVDGDIAQGQIGQAQSVPTHGKPKPVALYATRPLGAGEEVQARPVHLAKPRNLPESCWILPLAVSK